MNLTETIAIISLLGVLGIFLYSIYYIIDCLEKRKQYKPKITILLLVSSLFFWLISLSNMSINPEIEFLPIITKISNLNIYIQALFFIISIFLWLKDKATISTTHYKSIKFYREK